jgi:sodium/bile acid cotransporter 7
MKRIGRILTQAGIDGFLALLIAAVVLAALRPEIGAGEGSFSLSALAGYGISGIFFFYGLRLSGEKLRTGLGNKRLHVLIHLATFVLFPLLILLIRPLFRGEENILLWLGIFYLAALPSTVSSSVVMVSIAGGNIPAAIFNASISGVIGVFITPLWMSFILSSKAGLDLNGLWPVIGKLIVQVLLPVLLGMLLHRFWGAFAEKHKRTLRLFDQTVILLIVYTSFCASFAGHVFEGFSIVKIVLCGAGMVLLFFVVYGLVTIACRRLKMNREETITAQFCGSKKSLVHGTAMSKVIFAGYGGTGVILLPIMLYHALQLMVVSAIARKKARELYP